MQNVRNLIETKKSGVDELDIKLAEEKLGLIFPEQYKELFKLVNNAEIGEWILYSIKTQINPKKTWDDVVRQNKELRDERMSEDLIAIGDDGSGDILCFKKMNGKMGDTIYLWNHESTELEEYAPSLKEFIIIFS
ncbi:Cell wall assembly regulator SMI1 [Bacillus sp. OV166]|uniref:SMI1/KNR4 family protein n=1 Tax=Bacillus sp. OV166 TaxID=1882763 RepID=UPI000A2AB29A|nr:SMI1/KNR4 family protein [Bacillus sp. OV166]SMQ77503.1 Cell wall assembly regulator SMI1 [Bacillus sp. OV166]